MFKTFTTANFKKIVNWFTPVKKTINAMVYKEGDPVDFVYVVKQGEFRITRRLHRQNKNREMSAHVAYYDCTKA